MYHARDDFPIQYQICQQNSGPMIVDLSIAMNTLLQPPRICPLNTLQNLSLSVDTLSYIDQIVHIFQKLPLNPAGQSVGCSLTEDMGLADQEAVIFV